MVKGLNQSAHYETMSDQDQSQQAVRRTVAVIGVHGVGDQKPFDTARKLGDLLQDLPYNRAAPTKERPVDCAQPGPEPPSYFPFHEEKFRLNVNPVVVRGPDTSGPPDTSNHPKTLGPFNAWVAAELRKTAPSKGADKELREQSSAGNYDIFAEFMQRQLFCYGGEKPEDTYETIRLEGTRAAHGNSPPIDLHVYELYWADLSRLKAGIYSIFTELYQLLFHLSSLGLHAINAAALDHPHEAAWRWLRKFQGWSSTILTVPLPVFNLFMLSLFGVLLLVVIVGTWAPAVQLLIIISSIAIALSVITGRLLWVRMAEHPISGGVWLTSFLFWPAAAAIPMYFVWHEHVHLSSNVLGSAESVIAFFISTVLVFVVLSIYETRRPGVLRWGIGLCLASFIVGIVTFPILSRQLDRFHLATIIPQFWVREFEVAYACVTLSWFVFFVLSVANCLAGLLAVHGSTPTKLDLAKRTRWTGWLMLGLPSLMFYAVTVIGWGVMAKAAERFLPADHYIPFVPWITATSAKELATAFLAGPVEIMLPIALALGAFAALPAIWGMFPVVWSEIFPPRPFEALQHSRSVPLGQWLTLAYRRALVVSGFLMYAVIIFVIPTGALLEISGKLPKSLAIQYLGMFSGALFAWLFLARGSVRKLALGFRPSLDILLDVDNWLREHPRNNNPKARICGRYVSLLRYISNWRNAQNPDGYEKIVIIAHSQGTVITTDLFRFLHAKIQPPSPARWRDRDPQLQHLGADEKPVIFFSMGCPLRQLYGLRFPYLYRWARHSIETAMLNWMAQDLGHFGPLPAPDPADLGFFRWVNAFRSGDYIGRNLWRTDKCGYAWYADACAQPGPPPKPNCSTDGGARIEFCIGAGAHTHYWDETAPAIPIELDRLIAL
jgi:hypothetical protein